MMQIKIYILLFPSIDPINFHINISFYEQFFTLIDVSIVLYDQ